MTHENDKIMTEEQLVDVQTHCYRMEAVLKAAQDAIDDEDMEQAKLLLESGRITLWLMTNMVEDSIDFGRSDKPSDL